MQRIHDPSAAASLPSPPALTGAAGYFTEGVIGTTPPTNVRGWFFNMLQEEMISVLSAAGITPDTTATNFTQLLQAIQTLITQQGGHGQCRLSVASATQIILAPYNGANIRIAGSRFAIPAAGITASNSGLVSNTTYYTYLYNNSGTLALELSTAGHVTDITAGNVGVEVKSGDNTRTLVGMLYTNSSSQFTVSAAASQLLLNWFNRRPLGIGLPSITGSTGASSFTGIGGSAALLTWAGEQVTINLVGTLSNGTAGAGASADLMIDGAVNGNQCDMTSVSVSAYAPASAGVTTSLSEGFHQVQAGIRANGGGTASATVAFYGTAQG